METYNYPKFKYTKNIGDGSTINTVLPPARTPKNDTQETNVDDLAKPPYLFILGLLFFLSFGGLTNIYMKITQDYDMPKWSIVMYLIPISISFFWLIKNPLNSIKTAFVGLPLLLFCIYAFLSFKWSNQPDVSMRQGLLLCLTYMVATTFAAKFNWRSFGFVLITIMGLQTFVSLILAVIFPQWGVMSDIYPGAWAGIWGFKQTLGVAMALGIGFTSGYAVTFKSARVFCIPIILTMLLVVYKSEATTATLISGMVIGISIALFIASLNPATAVISFWGIVVVGVTVVLSFTIFKDAIFHALGKAPTLTGRTDIWKAMEGPISEHPTFGWGFQAFWTDKSIASPVEGIQQAMDGFRPPDAHSTPMDVKVQLGSIGFFLWSWMFIQLWISGLYNVISTKYGTIIIGVAAAWSGICFTEAMSLYPMDYATFLLHSIFVKSSLEMFDKIFKINK